MSDDTPIVQGPDPWKSFRGVMAGTLILEAIVVLLALPVVGLVGGGLTTWSMAYLIGLAVLLVLLAGALDPRLRLVEDDLPDAIV